MYNTYSTHVQYILTIHMYNTYSTHVQYTLTIHMYNTYSTHVQYTLTIHMYNTYSTHVQYTLTIHMYNTYSTHVQYTLTLNSLPIYILKLYNNFFSEKLAKIINVAFATGIFPELLKLVKVIPTFKKGNKLLCENDRPISLLSAFSKIFEEVIYTRMYDYLMKNNLIYKRQFGFRNNHSTNHALISLSENIKSNLDSGQFSAEIFIDLQKAFDTVNHEILCEKLLHYGFRGIPQKLLESFLTNRKQYVSIKGYDSIQLDVKCGVPQESTLGPFLFLI